jgi:hypothetical protein
MIHLNELQDTTGIPKRGSDTGYDRPSLFDHGLAAREKKKATATNSHIESYLTPP